MCLNVKMFTLAAIITYNQQSTIDAQPWRLSAESSTGSCEPEGIDHLENSTQQQRYPSEPDHISDTVTQLSSEREDSTNTCTFTSQCVQ